MHGGAVKARARVLESTGRGFVSMDVLLPDLFLGMDLLNMDVYLCD